VKRQKQTVFLSTDPSERIADLKKKLSDINAVPPARIRLLLNESSPALEDDKTVGDLKLENDRVVYMVYKKDGTEEFEHVAVDPRPEAPKSDAPTSNAPTGGH